MDCYPCEETTGRKIKKREEIIEDDEGEVEWLIYVCPECGDISD